MNEQHINEIGKEISLAYIFHEDYGYFKSTTVAQWLGVDSLPDWTHQTILDLIAIDFISDAATQGNQKARRLMSYFMLHGDYSGRQTILGGKANLDSLESILTAINLQKAIAPHFIPQLENED
ncbi:hypothetical protein [Aulosira sp. FACHB-615]|uniref:hypothetical protein n=1 Tax=Aulosira sp. FACHB-615 TaxID=2692777 RepID=UPI0016862057|nr:hypothetical protein [Aulosira sp. FACHB-615]MBD2492565.1 hypothetical protein [Aulosira sp. FACHB-615]